MSNQADYQSLIDAAANEIQAADALLIGAGAGMGVDSGLPDFRGPEGFWKAYPPFRGRQFHEMSTPHWFRTDPQLAWGFFGHRLNLYRSAVPHRGFECLLRWGKARPLGWFVFTTNVDGQFQRAGFAETDLVEWHGSVHYLQCTSRCGQEIWPTADLQVNVDSTTIRATSELPRCPSCGAIARPNILMFNDWEWDEARSSAQQTRYTSWVRKTEGRRVVAIELGAGLAIPTVRRECEGRADKLIRINPREADVPAGGISLPMGAVEALVAIDQIIGARQG